LPSTQKIVLAT